MCVCVCVCVSVSVCGAASLSTFPHSAATSEQARLFGFVLPHHSPYACYGQEVEGKVKVEDFAQDEEAKAEFRVSVSKVQQRRGVQCVVGAERVRRVPVIRLGRSGPVLQLNSGSCNCGPTRYWSCTKIRRPG